jgi:pilus assembly protein CpaB
LWENYHKVFVKKKLVNPLFLAALAVGVLCIFLITKALKDLEAEKQQQVQAEQSKNDALKAAAEEAKKKLEDVLKKRGSVEVPKAQTRTVVCFKAPLQSRTEVNRVMVELREYPLDMIPDGAFSDVKEVVGKFTVRSVDAKEVATATKVKSIREIGGMSYRITPGMRAIAIQVTPVSSSGNLISDGDFVDIMLSEKDKAGDFIRTRIFLQNIKILSFFASAETEQTAGLPKTAPDTATVEVTPEQAEGLIQAKTMGDMSLVLRSVKDQKTVRTRGFERNELSSDIGVIQSRSKRTLIRVAEEQLQEKERQEAAFKDGPKVESSEGGSTLPSVDSNATESKETPQ